MSRKGFGPQYKRGWNPQRESTGFAFPWAHWRRVHSMGQLKGFSYRCLPFLTVSCVESSAQGGIGHKEHTIGEGIVSKWSQWKVNGPIYTGAAPLLWGLRTSQSKLHWFQPGFAFLMGGGNWEVLLNSFKVYIIYFFLLLQQLKEKLLQLHPDP